MAMPAGEEMDLPHNLKELGECPIDQVILQLFSWHIGTGLSGFFFFFLFFWFAGLLFQFIGYFMCVTKFGFC